MKVRVHNDNTLVDPWVEKFKGTDITIPAEGLVMNREEAVEFKSSFFPPVFGANRLQDPISMKKIRIGEIVEGEESSPNGKSTEFDCIACGYNLAETKEQLATHVKENHLNQMVDDDEKAELLAAQL